MRARYVIVLVGCATFLPGCDFIKKLTGQGNGDASAKAQTTATASASDETASNDAPNKKHKKKHPKAADDEDTADDSATNSAPAPASGSAPAECKTLVACCRAIALNPDADSKLNSRTGNATRDDTLKQCDQSLNSSVDVCKIVYVNIRSGVDALPAKTQAELAKDCPSH